MALDGPQLHLALNHWPVLGPPTAAALIAAGLARRSDEWVRAGAWALLVVGVSAAVVYWSGERAADALLDALAGQETFIDAHMRAARWVLRLDLAAAAAAAAALAAHARRPAMRAWAAAGLLALAAACSGVGGWTAHLGGEIRHAEVR